MKPLMLKGYAKDPGPFCFIFSFYVISNFLCETILTFNDDEMSNPDNLIASSVSILAMIGGYLLYEYILVPYIEYTPKLGRKALVKLMTAVMIISFVIIFYYIIRECWF